MKMNKATGEIVRVATGEDESAKKLASYIKKQGLWDEYMNQGGDCSAADLMDFYYNIPIRSIDATKFILSKDNNLYKMAHTTLNPTDELRVVFKDEIGNNRFIVEYNEDSCLDMEVLEIIDNYHL